MTGSARAAEAAVAGVLEQAVEPVDVGQVGLGAVASASLSMKPFSSDVPTPARVRKPQLVGEEMDEGAGHVEEVAGAVEDHEGAGGGDTSS